MTTATNPSPEDLLTPEAIDARVFDVLKTLPRNRRVNMETVRDRAGFDWCSTVSLSLDRLYAAGRTDSRAFPVRAA